MQKLLGVGQVARLLRLSEDKVRALADEGEIASQRTVGGHRRFTEAAVAQYEARKHPSTRRRKQAAPKRQLAKAAASHLFDDFADEDEEFFDEYGDLPEADVPAPVVQARPPARSPVALTQSVRDHKQEAEEERRGQVAAETSRLQGLKAYGTTFIPYDVPITVRSKIVEELEAYVTSERLPAWVSTWEQHTLVKGHVDAIVDAHRKQVIEDAEEAKAEEARRVVAARASRSAQETALRAKAEAEHRVQSLIAHGKRYAEQELREFEGFDRWEIRVEVVKALREEVEDDWSNREVEALVDEIVDDEAE